jgi:elongation factor P
MKATNIRKGQVLLIEGTLYRVLNMDHITPGKGRAHIQTKLRNIVEGTQTEIRFRSDEDVERAIIETRDMQYLYVADDEHHFMDLESYEQLQLSAELLGDAAKYIIPESTIQVQVHEGRAIGVELPASVALEVVETAPGIKDATASSQRKPATLETGLVVQVPPFINEGESIKVSTIDGSYLERAK